MDAGENYFSPLTPTKAVVISGITVHLAEHLEHSLLFKLGVDGTDLRSVLLKRQEKPVGDHSLQEPLNLRDGSTLSVQVQKKHRWKKGDYALALLNLSLEDIWPTEESNVPDVRIKKYPIRLPDPRQQIWLNVSTVSSSPKPGLNDERMTANSMEDAVHNLQRFKTILGRLGRARDPLDKALKIARVVSELTPIAKIIVACVQVVYDEFKTQDQHHKEILTLAESMARTMTFIPSVEVVARSNELKSTIQAFPDLMNETVDFIRQWLKRDKSNFFSASENQAKIESLEGRYIAFEKAFDRGVAIDSAVKIDYVKKSQELEELEKRLEGVTRIKPRVKPCMDGTRIDILSDIESKINNLEDKNVVWIYGAPGSGKSAVSLTMKSRLHKQGHLVTYFRFDRNDSAATTSSALWRCVAYDLADQYPSVRESILLLLRSNKVDLTSTMDLFISLIEEPLSKLTDLNSQTEYPFVVIIDALDECGGFEGRSSPDRQALLQTIGRWPRLPEHFKLIVTSREEGDVTRILSSISTPITIPSGNVLNDKPHALASISASQDIHKFLESRFQQIREPLSLLPPNWPGQNTIANMVRCAAGNFMWATTAATFIDSGLDPEDQLKNIIGDAPEPMSMEPLYSLYSTILKPSFGNFAGDSSKAGVLRAVLGTIVYAQRPLEDIEYTKLPTTIPVNGTMLQLIRDRLRSVIDPGPTLRFIHKSFDDFLLSNKCPPEYAIRTDEAQHILTKLCVTTMTAMLRFNMCNLETSCLKNTDVPNIEEKVKDHIPALLSYSCCFWADHLARTPFNEQIMGEVKCIILDKLLYWFEAMSLLKETNRVSHSLLVVLNWVNSTSHTEFSDFVRDARQFFRAFIHPISRSAPHIYISALPFTPEHSPVAMHYLPRFPRILTLTLGKPMNWSPCIFTSENHKGAIGSLAFSPDEKYFISGSTDKTVCICDSETGGLISGPFTGTDYITSSFYDSNGQYVWTICWNGQIIGWDVETGEKYLDFWAGGDWGDVTGACCINGGRNIVSTSARQGTVTLWSTETGKELRVLFSVPSSDKSPQVSFSPDGSYMAWADPHDTAVRIWKLVDGIEVEGPLCSQPQHNHTKPISALSFAVDGNFAVSGSKDGTILVWDMEIGGIFGRPITTGKDSVTAVAYSHQDRRVVSASGVPGRLMVWNTSTYEVVLGPLEGHTLEITKVALSRDYRRALSASCDGTVRMWDLRRKGSMPAVRATESHRDRVKCIAFSPCGQRMASLGSDRTIRVWDPTTGKPFLNAINTPSPYFKIIFSPDGNQIVAFGSNDGTLGMWNAITGEVVFHQDLSDANQEHTCINHISFRSTDQRLVTCSSNSVVRIWSLENNGMTEELCSSSPVPKYAGTRVEILALSPDGSTVVVRDDSGRPSRYMWSTTTHQTLPLTFIDGDHITGFMLAYSPSGRFFTDTYPTLWMKTAKLRVWDAQTGKLTSGPSVLDDNLGSLSLSPNGCYIAFSYQSFGFRDETTIWIWNTRTNCPASASWRGHIAVVTALTFSPNGEKLASGSEEGEIRIWDMLDLFGASLESNGAFRGETRVEDGWALGENGELLFRVPMDHRHNLFRPRNVAVIGGHGIPTKLDFTMFRYGENWMECFEDGK